MSESTVNLLLQIPLAGVVVLVVYFLVSQFLKHMKEERQARDAQQKEELAIFMQAIREQREQNLESLKEITRGFADLVETINTRLDQMALAVAKKTQQAERNN